VLWEKLTADICTAELLPKIDETDVEPEEKEL
jgi:hypothetical protein